MSPEIWESVQPPAGMPVKHTQLLLAASKFWTQMASLAQSAVRFPFFAVLDGAFFPFFPGLRFVFFDLLADPFLTFFMPPEAALLAAFFGVPRDFFFFFFKVRSFRVIVSIKKSNYLDS
jgi:hypothetical protein